MAYNERSLDDYIDVAQRIADFREKYPDGFLQPSNYNEPYKIVQAMGWEKDGTQVMQTFIVVVAAAYRTQDDIRPGVGMAWEIFPGRTPYTRGSELQNAETSAWGRAIIAVGASDSKRGIASREEVRNRQAERDERPKPEGWGCYCGDDSDEHFQGLTGHRERTDGLPSNRDGSLSRSRTTDEQKQAAGVMTDAEQRAHNQLAKPPPNTGKVERVKPGVAWDDPSGLGPAMHSVGMGAVDDRWTSDAPSWLVGVDPPEDQPGSILPAQRSQIMAVYTALGFKDRNRRIADMNSTLVHLNLLRADQPQYESTNDLSHQQAARLLENLHERHTGKTTRR